MLGVCTPVRARSPTVQTALPRLLSTRSLSLLRRRRDLVAPATCLLRSAAPAIDVFRVAVGVGAVHGTRKGCRQALQDRQQVVLGSALMR